MKVLKLFIILLISSISSFAQVFSEGEIVYDVYTDGGDKTIGNYIISIKGNYVRQEMNLNGGFKNVVIINGKEGSSATLRTIQNTPYALMQSRTELLAKNKQFINARYTYTESSKKIANYSVQKCTVKYKNGNEVNLLIANDLKIDNEHLLAMFPKLTHAPLKYEIDRGNASMKFIAQSVQRKNIDSELFTIPKHYKIVTPKELESLR